MLRRYVSTVEVTKLLNGSWCMWYFGAPCAPEGTSSSLCFYHSLCSTPRTYILAPRSTVLWVLSKYIYKYGGATSLKPALVVGRSHIVWLGGICTYPADLASWSLSPAASTQLQYTYTCRLGGCTGKADPEVVTVCDSKNPPRARP